jgi:hypothetical protein
MSPCHYSSFAPSAAFRPPKFDGHRWESTPGRYSMSGSADRIWAAAVLGNHGETNRGGPPAQSATRRRTARSHPEFAGPQIVVP